MYADPSPLSSFDLRLLTPRLELRLPSHDEIVALYRVAALGIHVPMRCRSVSPGPTRLTDFVAFHEHSFQTWAPSSWNANFVSFLDGRAIGMQSLLGREFADRREVHSGSWLGLPGSARGWVLAARRRLGVGVSRTWCEGGDERRDLGQHRLATRE